METSDYGEALVAIFCNHVNIHLVGIHQVGTDYCSRNRTFGREALRRGMAPNRLKGSDWMPKNPRMFGHFLAPTGICSNFYGLFKDVSNMTYIMALPAWIRFVYFRFLRQVSDRRQGDVG